jgi:hypothetical protein
MSHSAATGGATLTASAGATLRPRRPAALTTFGPAALAAAGTLLLGLPTLIMPLHPDQALFAMVGRTVGAGGAPYVDAWDFKPPSLYAVYALAVRGPFDVARNVRAFDLGWNAMAAACVAELGRRWWGAPAGILAGLIFALVWSTGTPWWQSAQPDSLVVLPLTLGLLLYDPAAGRRARLVAAGLILGFAVQMRFNIALLIPVFPLVELARVPRGRRPAVWLHAMVWLGVGVAAFHVALAAYLLPQGALGEYVATMQYAAGYARVGGPWNPPGGPTVDAAISAIRLSFWNWAGFRLILSIPAFAAGAYGALVRRDPRIIRLVLFALLIYAGITLQAKFFWYHYGYLMPILALIGAWGWLRLFRRLSVELSRAAAIVAVGLMAGALTAASQEVWDSGRNQWTSFVRYARRPDERTQILHTFPGYAAEVAVAGYVRENTPPGRPIYVWGFDPLIYLFADRPAASRFLLSFPLMSEWAPARWQQAFIEELERTRPEYIVVQRGQPGNWIVGHNNDMAEYIGRFSAFQELLDEQFELETEILGNLLYRRRPDAAVGILPGGAQMPAASSPADQSGDARGR